MNVMIPFTILTVSLFAGLALRASCADRLPTARLWLGLFSLLYFTLGLCFYLWRQAPSEIQILIGFLFAAGALAFLGESLWLFLEKNKFQAENLKLLKKQKGPYQEILSACRLLAEENQGALIILERKQNLGPWCQKGIRLAAEITKELLFSVFTPPGSLHDGAAMIQKNKLAACSVIVPLSSSSRLPKELGTRHRAAVGFSELTDGLCLIVSEETGSISIADRGTLHYNIPFALLPDIFERSLRFKRPKSKFAMPPRESSESISV